MNNLSDIFFLTSQLPFPVKSSTYVSREGKTDFALQALQVELKVWG